MNGKVKRRSGMALNKARSNRHWINCSNVDSALAAIRRENAIEAKRARVMTKEQFILKFFAQRKAKRNEQ